MALGPASAQATAASHRAVDALAAVWRPIAADQIRSPQAVANACAGAVEESAAVEAAMPADLAPEAMQRIRSLGGFIVVPINDAPGGVYFIPPPEMAWFASGYGAVLAVSESEGLMVARDAAGRDIALQLGRIGARPVLRIRDPSGALQSLVGCLSLAGAPNPQ
jgi:hypothetical protein